VQKKASKRVREGGIVLIRVSSGAVSRVLSNFNIGTTSCIPSKTVAIELFSESLFFSTCSVY